MGQAKCVHGGRPSLLSPHPVGALPGGAFVSTGCAALRGGMRPSLNDCHVWPTADRERTAKKTTAPTSASASVSTLVANLVVYANFTAVRAEGKSRAFAKREKTQKNTRRRPSKRNEIQKHTSSESKRSTWSCSCWRRARAPAQPSRLSIFWGGGIVCTMHAFRRKQCTPMVQN